MQENPDAYTVLGIDLDSREDNTMIKDHVEKNHFVGMFAATPVDFTRSLIKTLGQQVVQTLPQTVIVYNKKVPYVGDGAFPEDKNSKVSYPASDTGRVSQVPTHEYRVDLGSDDFRSRIKHLNPIFKKIQT